MPISAKWHRVIPESTEHDMSTSSNPIEIETQGAAQECLCEHCRALELGSAYLTNQVATGSIYGVEDPDHPGFVSLSNMQQSAARCECCRFFLDSFRRIMLISQPSTLDETSFRNGLPQCRLLGLWVRVATASFVSAAMQKTSILTVSYEEPYSGQPLEVATDFVLARKRDDLSIHADGRINHVSNELTSAEAADIILAWYAECDQGHSKCESSTEAREFTPRRLLHVGSIEDPVLYLCCNPPTSEPYIALSYCWGSSHEFKTTRENLSRHAVAIRERGLPKTYRDIVNIARALDIRWLWIDAFCIVQGDLDDWNQESYHMDEVYHNARLTICASNASNVQEGFLRTRRQPAVPCGSIFTDKLTETLFVTEGIDADPGGASLGSEPLTQRGWTVQERILSRRSVYFTTQQMLWQCSSVCRGENGLSDHGVQEWQSSMLRVGRLSTDTTTGAINWKRSVSIYSRCKLSNGSDRLPAISGLAKRYASILKDQYIAGHWRNTLLDELTWYRVMAQTSKDSRPSQFYLAPSWAWAAVDGPIRFSGSLRRGATMAQVTSVQLIPRGTNIFGEIASGHLDLCAPHFRAELSTRVPSYAITILAAYQGKLCIFLQKQDITIPQVWLDHSIEAGLVNAVVLSSRSFNYSEDDPTERQAWSGLLLLPVDGDAGHFRRVGAFIDQAPPEGMTLKHLSTSTFRIV